MDIFPFVCFSIWHHITVHLIMTAWSLIVLRAPEVSKATQQIYICYNLTLDNRCLATALKNSNRNHGISSSSSQGGAVGSMY